MELSSEGEAHVARSRTIGAALTDPADLLPSWRSGSTCDAIVGFLAASDAYRPADRVAVFDNDGTLWCELRRIRS